MNHVVGVTDREDVLAAKAQIRGVKTATTRSWTGVRPVPAEANDFPAGLALGLV